jgi:hypothetical protein
MTALETHARRAAKRIGFLARKSRRRKRTCDNRGAFMLLNERRNVVAGVRFDLSEAVIYYCESVERARRKAEQAAKTKAVAAELRARIIAGEL